MAYHADYRKDDVLLKAIEKADADVAKAKKDADEKKWRIVADQMKVLKVCYSEHLLVHA